MNVINTRRLFRGRFECYVDQKDPGAGGSDGSPLTLEELCNMLEDDPEPFPPCYDRDMRKLCSHEYLTWFRKERSYGDVARLLNRKMAGENGRMSPVGGRWVSALLKSSPSVVHSS